MAKWIGYTTFLTFFGGLFLTNTVPHFVNGVMGQPFQSPFAKPPGVGLSSSTLNVIWAFINLVIGYILLCQVGHFDLHSWLDAIVVGAAILLGALFLARNFGRLNGGNNPE